MPRLGQRLPIEYREVEHQNEVGVKFVGGGVKVGQKRRKDGRKMVNFIGGKVNFLGKYLDTPLKAFFLPVVKHHAGRKRTAAAKARANKACAVHAGQRVEQETDAIHHDKEEGQVWETSRHALRDGYDSFRVQGEAAQMAAHPRLRAPVQI